MGRCYERGIVVEKDIKKAVECYQQSAAQGCAAGLNNLDRHLEKGGLWQAHYKFEL